MTRPERYTEFRASVETALDGIIKGTAMAYGTNIPRGPGMAERVEPGAFRAQMNAANRIPVLWQHDRDNPIGRATHLEDKDNALTFTAKILTNADVPDARKVLALLAEGVVDEISVGFEWGSWKEERGENGETTIVHEKARLRELSVVTFGALGRRARVHSVAALDGAGSVNVAAYRERLARLRA